MRISRRFMALALTLCLALTMIPGMAMAAGVTVADAAGLTNAINAAAGETTITLTADITTTSALTINNNKNIILDLGGHNITNGTDGVTVFAITGGAKLSITGTGTISGTGKCQALIVGNAEVAGAELILGSGVTVTAPDGWTITVWRNGKLTSSGNINNGCGAAISGNGTYHGTKINITGGSVTTGAGGLAIYHPQDGILNISGGTVKGGTGIEMRSGTLNVTGGTIEAIDSFGAPVANGSGSTAEGVAIAVSQHATNLPINVSITGGTIKATGADGKALYAYDVQSPGGDNSTINVSGGNFIGEVGLGTDRIAPSLTNNRFISGGTFSTEPADELVAPNKGVISEEDKFVLVDAISVGGIKIYPAVLDFGTVKVGYTQPAPQTVYIESESGGNFKLEASGDGYIINGSDNSNEITVGNDETATFTVQPKAGLGAGVYDVTINVINVSEIVPSPSAASDAETIVGLFFSRALASTAPGITVKFRVDPASSGSGISVKYTGGNGFSSSKPDVPTGVEIDGVPVSFTGDGRNFTVSCIKPDSRWITVRWNSTSVTTNFTPDAAAYCSPTNIPKTGDASLAAFVVMAIVAAAGAMRRK